jgi:hypothetical protein
MEAKKKSILQLHSAIACSIHVFVLSVVFLMSLFICNLTFAWSQTFSGESATITESESQKKAISPSSDFYKANEFTSKYTLFRTVLMTNKGEAWLRIRSSEGSQPDNARDIQVRRIVFGDKISGWQLVGLTQNKAIFRKGSQTISLVIPKEDRPPAKITPPLQKKATVSESDQKKRQQSLHEFMRSLPKTSLGEGVNGTVAQDGNVTFP